MRIKSLLTILLISVYNLVLAQSPFSQRISFNTLLPSINENMGLIEFSHIDTLKEILTNPAFSTFIKKNHLILSTSYYIDQYEISLDYENYGDQYDHIKISNFSLPIGGVIRLGDVSILGLASFLNLKENRYHSENRTYYIDTATIISQFLRSTTDYKGDGFMYHTSLGYRLNDDFSLGIGYQKTKYYPKGISSSSGIADLSFNYHNDNLILGLTMNLSESDLFTISVSKYKDEDSFLRESKSYSNFNSNEYNGWEVQYKYRRKLNSKLDLTNHFTFNYQSHEKREYYGYKPFRAFEGNTESYQIGLGFLFHEEDLALTGEVIYEPVQYEESVTEVHGAWDPFVTGGNESYKNWKLRLGGNIRLLDFINWQVGAEYFSVKMNKTYTYDYVSKDEYFPYYSTGKFKVTSGFKLCMSGFEFLYGVIYSSEIEYIYRNFSEFPKTIEKNPIQHRFLLIYKF